MKLPEFVKNAFGIALGVVIGMAAFGAIQKQFPKV